jgi:hypothetical protein
MPALSHVVHERSLKDREGFWSAAADAILLTLFVRRRNCDVNLAGGLQKLRVPPRCHADSHQNPPIALRAHPLLRPDLQ